MNGSSTQDIPSHENQSGKDYISEVIHKLKEKGDSEVSHKLKEKGDDVWSKASKRLIDSMRC